MPDTLDNDSIQTSLLDYIFEKSDCQDISEIPLDKSLLAEGILDSFGIIELVEFIESHWSITIEDSEFTLERMGSVTKMTALVYEKTK